MNVIKSSFKLGKKNALTALMIAASTTMFAGYVSATVPVTVTWTGVVPGSTSDGSMVVTGLNGLLGEMSGQVTAKGDGTFTSTQVRLEAHPVDPTSPSGGPQQDTLIEANWQLETATLTYGGREMADADLHVMFDGTKVDVGQSVSNQQMISLTVEQSEVMEQAMVAEQGVQVAVTLLIDPA